MRRARGQERVQGRIWQECAEWVRCPIMQTCSIQSNSYSSCHSAYVHFVADQSLVHKHRYEPRYDKEGLGAKKHLPKQPCVAKAWAKLATLGLVDKKTEADFAGWLKNTKAKKGKLRCPFRQK